MGAYYRNGCPYQYPWCKSCGRDLKQPGEMDKEYCPECFGKRKARESLRKVLGEGK